MHAAGPVRRGTTSHPLSTRRVLRADTKDHALRAACGRRMSGGAHLHQEVQQNLEGLFAGLRPALREPRHNQRGFDLFGRKSHALRPLAQLVQQPADLERLPLRHRARLRAKPRSLD